MSKISAQMANTIASAAQIPLVAVNALYAHFPMMIFSAITVKRFDDKKDRLHASRHTQRFSHCKQSLCGESSRQQTRSMPSL